MRKDHAVIVDWIDPGSRVLDLGCGDGTLLAALEKEKKVRGQGIELSESCIYRCVEKGINVFHSNIETGLDGYGDGVFDVVILNQSLQEVTHIADVLQEALRVGRRVIVGIPNFAHFSSRWRLFFLGRAPVTPALPYDWSDTPNVRFMSLTDFRGFCRIQKIRIVRETDIGTHGIVRIRPNLQAVEGLFLLERESETL